MSSLGFLLLLSLLTQSLNDSFAQPIKGFIKDIDGNRYSSVVIGNQEWMRENLHTTRYNDGTPIPEITDPTEWRHTDSPAFVWYDNDISNKNPFGALYNWYAVGSRQDICPAGWRVASDEDWKELETYLGMIPEEVEGTAMRGEDEGGKLKEAGLEKWISPNTGATNESGLSIIPSGRRASTALFIGLTSGGTIWTSTESSLSNACYRHFATGSAQIGRNPEGDKKKGLAVRCIKIK